MFYKGDDGVKSHLNLAVLAYWLVSAINYQLREVGICQSWSGTLLVLGISEVASSQVKKEDATCVEIRQCTEQGENVMEIFRGLNLQDTPIKRRRKFVGYPEHPPNKIIISVQPYRLE